MGKVHSYIAFSRLSRKLKRILPAKNLTAAENQICRLDENRLNWIYDHIEDVGSFSDLLAAIRSAKRAVAKVPHQKTVDALEKSARVHSSLSHTIRCNM